MNLETARDFLPSISALLNDNSIDASTGITAADAGGYKIYVCLYDAADLNATISVLGNESGYWDDLFTIEVTEEIHQGG